MASEQLPVISIDAILISIMKKRIAQIMLVALISMVVLVGCSTLMYRVTNPIGKPSGPIAVVGVDNDASRFMGRMVQAELIQEGFTTRLTFDRAIIPKGAESPMVPLLESVAAGIGATGKIEMDAVKFEEFVSTNDIDISAIFVESMAQYLTTLHDITGANLLIVVETNSSMSETSAMAIDIVSSDIVFVYHIEGNDRGLFSVLPHISGSEEYKASGIHGWDMGSPSSPESKGIAIAKDIVEHLLGTTN